MTTREKNTILNAYYLYQRNGEGYGIRQAYSKPSYRKRTIWEGLRYLYKDLRVTTHNSQVFCCTGYDIQGSFTVITPCHRYSVTRQQLAALLEG